MNVESSNGSSNSREALLARDAALAYQRAGLSVVPIKGDGSKSPPLAWKEFQSRIASEAEIASWFSNGHLRGVAVLGGRISGNAEHLDFDEDAPRVFSAWRDLVEDEMPGLFAKLCIRKTPGAGFHASYRCEDQIPGNTDLAFRPDPDDPQKRLVLIQTRGEGGYVLAPGCPACCHPSGGLYQHFQGPKLSQIQTVIAAEREVLWRCARALDEMPQEETDKPSAFKAKAGKAYGLSPGDDYNARGPGWASILDGWTLVREHGGKGYWRRPGKEGPGWSATTGCKAKDGGHELFFVFSSNASPFEPQKSYSKFGAYALLHHAGDFVAAAKELRAQGFGTAREGAKATAGTASPEPWDTPVDFDTEYDHPDFPVETLPPWLAEWIRAEAQATQTPQDLPGMLALAVAGAGMAGKFRVVIREGWSEPVNLFVAIALLPGERKTAVFADVLGPVQVYEGQEILRLVPIIAEADSAHRMMEVKLKKLEGKAASEEDAVKQNALKNEAMQLAKELAEHVVPEEPQYFCDDTTPEKLVNLLAHQGGRILQASAEGTAFEIAKGRYSETANFDVYLKGHAGDPLRSDRISRASDKVDRPALSCALAVQPDVIRGLAEQASLRGRGFLARWLYAIPRSLVGTRQIAPPAVPEKVAQEFNRAMLATWNLKGTTDKTGRPAPHHLRLSAESEKALREFESWLEPQLAEGEELSYLAGWANKLAGAIARVAAIIHIAEAVGDVNKACLDPIALETMQAAIRQGRDYLLPHAQVAFGMMGADPRIGVACLILDRIQATCEYSEYSESAPLSVRRRDIHQGNRRKFQSVDDLDPILELLVKHGWLRPTGEGRPGRGGFPSPVYHVNPAILNRAKKGGPRTHSTHSTHSPFSGDGKHREPGEDDEP
jgi:hypothetical protein